MSWNQSLTRSKYHNKPCNVDEHKFPSRREAERYLVLRSKAARGEIRNLRLQVKFQLSDFHRIGDERLERATYIADFVYEENGKTVVEDCKGFRTDVYKLKRKWMYEKYGILIKET